MNYLQIWLQNHNRRLTQEAIDEALMEYISSVEKQRDELLSAAEAVEIDSDEVLDFDECTAMLVPLDTYHKLMEAVASVKGNHAKVDQCAECKSIALTTAADCRKCEENTPAFTDSVDSFMKGGA